MINIMFAGNHKVYDGMLIASISILKHCHQPINCYILTMDLSDQDPNFRPITNEQASRLEVLYQETNPQNKVILIDVKELYKRELGSSPNNKTAYTPYTLLRLLADKIDILPDKILYLDTDIVANGNISQLYDIDITNHELAGVRDYYGKFFFYPRYINAGVLLMNLDKIRQSGLMRRAIRMCNKRRVFLSDQTAINKYARKKLIIDTRYNDQKRLNNDTIIRHFSMTLKFFPKFKKQNIKPWHVNELHNILGIHEFDDTLKRYQEILSEEELASDV